MNTVFTGMDREYEEVKKFHIAFSHPVAEKPTLLSEERADKRVGWMIEEISEFTEATEEKDVVGQADAMIDLIYFALGTLVEIGVKPQRIFDIVQNANMSKLWADGKPRYRESDSKIIKPEGWQTPEPLIQEEIFRQMRG